MLVIRSVFLPGLVILALGLTGCASQVATQSLVQDRHQLTLLIDDQASHFDDWALRDKADEVCPKGYEFLSQTQHKKGPLPTEGASCLAGDNCFYHLQWQIVCVDKPREPFSLFGKH